MKAVKKIFRKDNPESDVDTSGSDPEGSDINTSNPKTDMTLDFQSNSPAAEQMIATAADSAPDPEFSIALVSPLKPDPESLSESAPKCTTIRKNTPSPQPIKALQGLFSKLRPRSGVSSEESDAQCFVEDPVDQSSEKVVQPDGEISQVTYTQEQSDSHIKLDCHEKMRPEMYEDYVEAIREAIDVSTYIVEQQKTEEASSKRKGFLKLPYISTGSEDILQNGPGAPYQENTVDENSRGPLEIKMNVCATIKRNILPSILCGSSKTGPGPEQEGKIQGKIKNFVRSTLGKKEPQKTTCTSAKTSQTETHPSPAILDNKGGNTVDELSETQALKASSDRTQVSRHVSKEAVRKKPYHPTQQPSKTKTRKLTSKPPSVNVGDSHRDRSASVPPVGPAEHRNKRHSLTQLQSTRRNTRRPAQESSAGIHTTRDTSKHAFESRTEPPGKPHPSVASNRARAKDINKETQDRETQQSSRATTRKSTTIEKTERTYPPTASGTVTNRRQKSLSSDTTTNQSQPSRSESRKERNTGSTEKIPLRKPSISDRAQSMESTKPRNTAFNVAQVHKPVKKTSKDQTNHSSSRRKTSTASMVQSPAVQDKGQKLWQEDSGRVKDNEKRRSSAGKTKPATAGQDTAGKTKPVPADQDTAEAKAQGPSSKKKPASASAKKQNQHAEDLATVVPDNRQVGLRGSNERNTILCSKTTDAKTTESCQHQNMINNKTIESEAMEDQQEILKLVAPKMITVTGLTCCIDQKENQESVIVINTNDLERDAEHAKDGGVFVSDESSKVAQIKENDQKRFQQPDERTRMILNKIAQVEPSESQRTRVEECSEGHSKELHPPEDSNRVEERNKKSTYMQDDVAQGGYHKPISLEPYEHQNSNNNRKIDTPEQLENQGQAQSESKAQMESSKSPSLTCSSDQSQQVLDSDTDHVEHPAEIPLVDGPEEPLIEAWTKVSIPEKLTTDPADLITVTNLSFTWDTDSINKNQEEIQLVYDNTDDDVSIPEQLTDPADLSSSRDTEDSQTKQTEFQLVDRADDDEDIQIKPEETQLVQDSVDDDVSIAEQLTTDSADFITMTNFSSTQDTEDINTIQEEIQLLKDSADDDVSLSEKFTTDPTVIGTDLSSTVDREDIQINPEEIQLIQDAVDDDVSIAEQLITDSTDFVTVTNCSSTLDTEDMNTNQEEIQLIDKSADDDVSIPEKLTTDPTDLITVTNLSFTWDTDSINKNPEEIQLVYDITDDDVSIPEQLTDPADLSSSRDTEDSQTKQAEFQLVDRAGDDVSIAKQLSTDPADFITVSDLSTVDTEDIQIKPEETQLVQDSVDDDVSIAEQLTTDSANFITMTNFSSTQDTEDINTIQEEIQLIEDSADDDVSLSEKFTTDPTVIGTDLSSTVDREDIQINPEEIQLIQNADDDVSIAEQLITDSTDFVTVTNCSSTLDTEDMNTNQEEIQLIEESADDDVSIPEQLTTDPASFIIVTNHTSSIETNDINTKPEEIQRVQDSVDDHVSIPEQLTTDPVSFIIVTNHTSSIETNDINTKPEIQRVQDSVDDHEVPQGTQDKYSMINNEHAQTDMPKPAQEPEIVEAENSFNEDSIVTSEDQLGLEKYNLIQNEVSQCPLTTKSHTVQFTDSIRKGTKSMKDLHKDQEDISKRRSASFHDQKQNQTTSIPYTLPAVTCSRATSSAAQVTSLPLIQPSNRAKGPHWMPTEKKPGLLNQNQSSVIACYRIDHNVDPNPAAQEFSYSSAGFNTTTVLSSSQGAHVKLHRAKKRNGMELSKAVQGKTLKPIQQAQKAHPKDNSSKKGTSIAEDRPKRSYQPIEDNKRSKLVQSEVFQHGSNMCVHSEPPDEQPTDNGMKESKTMKNQQGKPKPVPVNLKVKPSKERITMLDDRKEEREPVIVSNTGDLYSGIDHAKDLDTVTPSEPLTEAQMNGFRAIFDLFTKDHTGFISTTGFTTTLNTIGITLKPADIHLALKKAGCNEDGLVGFQGFVSVLTDTQHFSKCVNEPEDITVTVFYKAITKMLKSGMLPDSTRDEILKYYQNKTQRLIHRVGRPHDAGGHVLTYYTKVAHLLGLSRHQLLNYIKPAAETDQRNPYLQKPCLSSTNRQALLKPSTLPRLGHSQRVKSWRTIEIEDRIRQLSIKHPGPETMEMITPVKIEVNLTLQERKHLSFEEIDHLNLECRGGLRRFRYNLTQYKRRDSWSSWGSLQPYYRLLHRRHLSFNDVFSTYSWSWSAAANMVKSTELIREPPHFSAQTPTLREPDLIPKNGHTSPQAPALSGEPRVSLPRLNASQRSGPCLVRTRMKTQL